MKKSFQTVYHIKDDKLIQIATKEFPIATLSDEGNMIMLLTSNPEPYQLSSQWTALFSMNDLAVMNIKNGNSKIAINLIQALQDLAQKENMHLATIKLTALGILIILRPQSIQN